MNLKTLSRIFSWRYARYLLALIGILALLLICLTGCKSSQMASEKHYHRRQSLASADSSRTVDLSVIHDTLTILRTETLWREPDTAGLIYPLITASSETSVSRHTDKNIVTIRADTIHITDSINHVATASSKSSAGCSPPSEGHPFLRWLPWVLLVGVVVFIFISRRTRRKKFP